MNCHLVLLELESAASSTAASICLICSCKDQRVAALSYWTMTSKGMGTCFSSSFRSLMVHTTESSLLSRFRILIAQSS
uniref:DCL1 n=1 Tax=Arundo donax TaxID=35708 RepID=A0A0A9D833_ARUDO